MYMLIFGWLRVADILSNPFGNDEVYDINLASTLDLNIWKSSLVIENQERAIHSDLLRNPYRKVEAYLETTPNKITSDLDSQQNKIKVSPLDNIGEDNGGYGGGYVEHEGEGSRYDDMGY